MTRDAKLPHGEDLEGGAQRPCDFERDGDAAPRQGEDDDVGPVGVRGEASREMTAGVAAIDEPPYSTLSMMTTSTHRPSTSPCSR